MIILKGKLHRGLHEYKGFVGDTAEIEISNEEILAQLSEKEKFNLASKLLIKPTRRVHGD